jgi:hypothetical protein
LDIGCGDGYFVIEIKINYNPKLIKGIDIDLELINQAINNL